MEVLCRIFTVTKLIIYHKYEKQKQYAVATQKEQESKGFFKLSWFERIAFGRAIWPRILYIKPLQHTYSSFNQCLRTKSGYCQAMFLGVRIIDAIWDPL